MTQTGRRTFFDSHMWFDRYYAVPGLLITSSICYLLLALNMTKWYGSESFLAWTRGNKVVVTVIVQVISHVLGLIHVQILCALMRMTFLTYISTRSFPLYLAQFVYEASTPRMTWALPSHLNLCLLAVVLASLFPAAIWSGAIAPLPAERVILQSLSIPSFGTQNISTLWKVSRNVSSYISGAVAEGQWMTDKGLFSFDPASVKYLLQPAAADASMVTQGSRRHAKVDKTGYVYLDRSFAAGSVAGFSQFSSVVSPNWYAYSEHGLKSNARCYYNKTIEDTFGWNLVENIAGGWVAQSLGKSATGGTIPFTTYWGVTPSDLFSWSSTYDNSSRTISVQLSTLANDTSDGWSFKDFQNIQCDLLYVPELFDVYTNITSKSIEVSPRNLTGLSWPASADEVLVKVSTWLWEFTRNDGCLGGCQLGRSLRLNVNRLQNATQDYSERTVLRGVEDYIASMTDNIMINFLLTRMIGEAPEATTNVQATVGLPAIVYGQRSFIVAIAALNTVILLLYTIELVRTRAWGNVPNLDMTNICDLLISASKGGMNHVHSTGILNPATTEATSTWTCPGQPFDDKVRMQLWYNRIVSDLPALVPLLDRDAINLYEVQHLQTSFGKPEAIESHGRSQTLSERNLQAIPLLHEQVHVRNDPRIMK